MPIPRVVLCHATEEDEPRAENNTPVTFRMRGGVDIVQMLGEFLEEQVNSGIYSERGLMILSSVIPSTTYWSSRVRNWVLDAILRYE